jgi:hypothetical protein
MDMRNNCTLLLYIPLFQQLLGTVSSLTWAIWTARAALTTVLALASYIISIPDKDPDGCCYNG